MGCVKVCEFPVKLVLLFGSVRELGVILLVGVDPGVTGIRVTDLGTWS